MIFLHVDFLSILIFITKSKIVRLTKKDLDLREERKLLRFAELYFVEVRVDGFRHTRGFTMPEPTFINFDRDPAFITPSRERVPKILDGKVGYSRLLNVSVISRVRKVRLVSFALYSPK